MLVLSRRLNEKVVLPEIEVAIQVLGARAGQVRLGIKAPPRVAVVREELLDQSQAPAPSPPAEPPPVARDELRQLNHLVRNRVNAATIGLALAHRQLQAGLHQDIEATLEKIGREIEALREQVQAAVTARPDVVVRVREDGGPVRG